MNRKVDFIDTAAAYNKEEGELTVFVMYTDDLSKSNTYETPDAIVPVSNTATKFENGNVTGTVQPIFWNVFRFKVQ